MITKIRRYKENIVGYKLATVGVLFRRYLLAYEAKVALVMQ